MRKKSVALFLLLLLTACSTHLRPLPLTLPAFQTVDFGLCEDYPAAHRSLAQARRDLSLCRQAGVRALRIAFSWTEMEPEPGKYVWDFWDNFIPLAVDEYGLRLIPYICYTPEWNATDEASNFWRSPPRDNAPFARFVEQLVARYGTRVHSWEIWNEPDNRDYWTGTPAQYVALLQAGANAVRRADPAAQVVMGGLAGNLEFLETLLAEHHAGQWVDVINLHSYLETWHPDALERLSEYVARAADLVAQYGQKQPLWLAEIGYSNFRRGAFVSDYYAARYAYEHTPAYQASALLRAHALALASGKVSLLAWYRINDLPGETEVIGDVNNRHLGLIAANGHPKPALRALMLLTRLLNAPLRCLDRQVLATRTLASDAQVHAFQTADGSLVWIAWLATTLPGGGRRHAEGALPDPRRETLTLRLPRDLLPPHPHIVLYDQAGAPRPPLSLRHQAADVVVENLLLRPEETLVAVITSDAPPR